MRPFSRFWRFVCKERAGFLGKTTRSRCCLLFILFVFGESWLSEEQNQGFWGVHCFVCKNGSFQHGEVSKLEDPPEMARSLLGCFQMPSNSSKKRGRGGDPLFLETHIISCPKIRALWKRLPRKLTWKQTKRIAECMRAT